MIIGKWSGSFCLCAILISLRTSSELWRWRPHCSMLVAILQKLSWLSHDVVSARWPSGMRRSWPSLLEDVLFIGDRGGTCSVGISVHCTLVALKLASYLSLGHASILQGKYRCPLIPRQVLCCAHGQNDEIQTLFLLLLEVFIGCRQTIPVLWVRPRD